MVKKLKARRMKETLDRLEEDYLDPSQRADPAASDPELARKLAEEHRDPVEQVRNSSVLKLVGHHFLEKANLIKAKSDFMIGGFCD